MGTGTASRPRRESAPTRRGGMLAAGVLALLTLSACSPDGPAAADTAHKFHEALASSDWSSACDMLQAKTREKVEDEQDGPCEERLQGLDLQDAGPVAQTSVYGRSALIEFENDAVFLAAEVGGWAVTAAGCTSDGEAPYTCKLGGK